MPTLRKITNPDPPTIDDRRPTTGHTAAPEMIDDFLPPVVEHQDLPPGWVWTTIGEITQPIDKVDPSIWPNKEFVYLDISSIDNTLYQVVEPKSYLGREAPSRARQLVHDGDVLFSTVRTYLMKFDNQSR
jgi:hypothetical protein